MSEKGTRARVRHADYVMMETFIVLGLCVILYEALDLFQSCYRNVTATSTDKDNSTGAGATAPSATPQRASTDNDDDANIVDTNIDIDYIDADDCKRHCSSRNDRNTAHGRRQGSHSAASAQRLPLLLDTVPEGDCVTVEIAASCAAAAAADNRTHILCGAGNNFDSCDEETDSDELLLIGGHRAQKPAANAAAVGATVYAISGAAVA